MNSRSKKIKTDDARSVESESNQFQHTPLSNQQAFVSAHENIIDRHEVNIKQHVLQCWIFICCVCMFFPLVQTLQCTACLSPVLHSSFSSTCARCGCNSIQSTPYHPPAPPTPPPPPPPPATAGESDELEMVVKAIRSNKRKKPYESLKHTQQCKRRKMATYVLGRLGVPISALRNAPTLSSKLLTVANSFRRQMRTAPSLR